MNFNSPTRIRKIELVSLLIRSPLKYFEKSNHFLLINNALNDKYQQAEFQLSMLDDAHPSFFDVEPYRKQIMLLANHRKISGLEDVLEIEHPIIIHPIISLHWR